MRPVIVNNRVYGARKLFGKQVELVRAHDGRPRKPIALVCSADKGRQTGAMAVVCGRTSAGAGDGGCSELEQVTSATAGAGVTRAQVPSARDVDGMEALPAVPVAFAFLWRRTTRWFPMGVALSFAQENSAGAALVAVSEETSGLKETHIA